MRAATVVGADLPRRGRAGLVGDGDRPRVTYEEYHPYGSTAWWAEKSGIQVSRKRYRYTGMEKDEETGLSYHSARYYATWLGRWCSADPIGFGDGANRLRYCASPVAAADYSGRAPYAEISEEKVRPGPPPPRKWELTLLEVPLVEWGEDQGISSIRPRGPLWAVSAAAAAVLGESEASAGPFRDPYGSTWVSKDAYTAYQQIETGLAYNIKSVEVSVNTPEEAVQIRYRLATHQLAERLLAGEALRQVGFLSSEGRYVDTTGLRNFSRSVEFIDTTRLTTTEARREVAFRSMPGKTVVSIHWDIEWEVDAATGRVVEQEGRPVLLGHGGVRNPRHVHDPHLQVEYPNTTVRVFVRDLLPKRTSNGWSFAKPPDTRLIVEPWSSPTLPPPTRPILPPTRLQVEPFRVEPRVRPIRR